MSGITHNITEVRKPFGDNVAWLVCSFCGRAYTDTDSMIFHLFHNHWKKGKEVREKVAPRTSFMAPGKVLVFENQAPGMSPSSLVQSSSLLSTEDAVEYKPGDFHQVETVSFTSNNNILANQHSYTYTTTTANNNNTNIDNNNNFRYHYPHQQQQQHQFQQQYNTNNNNNNMSFNTYNNNNIHNIRAFNNNNNSVTALYPSPVLPSTTTTLPSYQPTLLPGSIAYVQRPANQGQSQVLNVLPHPNVLSLAESHEQEHEIPAMAVEMEVSTGCCSMMSMEDLYRQSMSSSINSSSTLPSHSNNNNSNSTISEAEASSTSHDEDEEEEEKKTKKKKRPVSKKVWECPICFKKVTQSFNLTIHMRAHTGQKPFRCRFQCGKAFISSSHRSRHERVHTGLRPYPCTECSVRCSTSWNLKCHKKVHLSPSKRSPRKAKKYPCSYSCGKSFRTVTHRRDHERVHAEQPSNVCSHCSAVFPTFQDLQAHVQVHQNLFCDPHQGLNQAEDPDVQTPRPFSQMIQMHMPQQLQ